MNRGLLEKSLREAWGMTLLYAFVLFAFEVLLAYVLPTFHEQLQGSWLELEFVQRILEALLGTEVGGSFGPTFLQAFPWVHPVVLSVAWAHEITFCTRLPAGEIDRGTIDFLLGFPVTRGQVYVCDGIVLFSCGVVLTAALLLGNLLGTALAEGGETPKGSVLGLVLVNFLALYFAVGGLGYLVTACCDRRGRAVATLFVILLVSFLINFVAEFWQPARALRWFSVLSYYQPIVILREEALAIADVVGLVAVGAATWWCGGWVFSRRDICTV